MWNNDETLCSSLEEYLSVLRDGHALGKNVIVALNFPPHFDPTAAFEPKRGSYRTLDIFLPPHCATDTWEQFSTTALGVLTMAWSLRRGNLELRLFKVSDGREGRICPFADPNTVRVSLPFLSYSHSVSLLSRRGHCTGAAG